MLLFRLSTRLPASELRWQIFGIFRCNIFFSRYPVISVAMHADERDDPARLNPAAAFFAAAREQAAAQAPQHPMSSRPMVGPA
jgi:hypothetical protein